MHREVFKIFLLRWAGNFLLLSALAGVVLTFGPVIKEEILYRYRSFRRIEFVVAEDLPPASETAVPAANLFNVPAAPPAVLGIEPLSREFGVVIPKIGANAKIIPDVDAGDYNAYIAALKQGVAHARGTAYPGEMGNVYLFAHSAGNFWEISRWNAVFYLLKELDPGDKVEVFYQGRRYTYIIYDKKIAAAEETGYLSAIANFPMLTLQTCWPPGTTLKRLLVFGRLQS